jgi:hypothetical protein
MFRITYFLDDPPKRCAYLRETNGDYQPLEQDPYVVIAKEFDDQNKCSRTWFLGTHQLHDGESAPHYAPPLHRIVSPAIVPGEESKPADPMARAGGLQPVLHQLKQNQIKDYLKVKQHEQFCATYHNALQRAEQLQADLSAADENIRNLAKQRSLTHRIGSVCKSIQTKLRS